MRRPEALFFDLDETLLDGASAVQRAVIETCQQLAAANPNLDAHRLVDANASEWQRYWPEVEQQWALGLVPDEAVGQEAWRRTLAACRCTDEALVHTARQTHQQLARAGFRLFDDARELLAGLKNDLPLAVITNGAADAQREKLRVLGIEQRFDAVVISGEVRMAKPDASVFHLALDALGVPAGNAWHIGDSLSHDVAGARAAGLTAVWLNRGDRTMSAGDIRPDREIRSLGELTPLLR